VKLIIFGSLCLGLALYFQLDTSDQDTTYLIAAPNRQVQASKHTRDHHSDEAWEGDIRNKFQEDDDENIHLDRDHEAVVVHHDADINQGSNEQLLSQKLHDIQKDNQQQKPQKFDNLSDKVDEFNQDEQHIEGMVLSEKDGIDAARNRPILKSNRTVVKHTEKRALENNKQLGQESISQRRKLNNNRQVLQSDARRKKLSVADKSVVGGKPEIRIMPKHPSVPEGHTLMVTCADVLVLARRKSNDDAMYMTFELPQSLSRQLKNTVHILVRPGRLTGSVGVCVCTLVCDVTYCDHINGNYMYEWF
jgi:hypothetical protein